MKDTDIWKVAKATEQPYNGKPIEFRFSTERLNDFARAIEAEVLAELRKNVGKYSDIVSDGGLDPRNANIQGEVK